MPAFATEALPERFRPLTTAVAAHRVRIAHGARSRAALRAVGRPAATLGNVVHLQRAPDHSAATTELIAHELVHALGEPTRPRFYEEPGHDHEEARAMSVGRLARASRVTDAEPIRRVMSAPVMPRVAQRVEAPVVSASPAASAVPATAAVAATGVAAAQTHGASNVIRRVLTSDPSNGTSPTNDEQTNTSISASQRLNDFEELMAMIEQRVISEIERRGGRIRGGW